MVLNGALKVLISSNLSPVRLGSVIIVTCYHQYCISDISRVLVYPRVVSSAPIMGRRRHDRVGGAMGPKKR